MTDNKGFKNQDNILGKFVDALVSFLLVSIVYFPLILPWILWKKSFSCLSVLHSEKGILKTLSESRFSFFTWLCYFIDSLAFFSYIAGPVLIIVMANNFGFQGFMKSFLFFYFLPVLLHIFKELFLVLVKAQSNNNEESNSFSN
ncbi:MAG: hypothetical protein JXR58_07910 [Bacteroidales bacterium]|nr:hypothetical protein [Bacteroidales bacterium]